MTYNQKDMSVQRYIAVRFKIYPDDGMYAAECPEFDIASCGDTPEEALRNIREAVVLYIETLEEIGERDLVFRERGIEVLDSDHTEMGIEAGALYSTTAELVPVC